MSLTIFQPTTENTDEIYSIIKPYSDKNIVLYRSHMEIKESINTFLVAKLDNKIIGVISFYNYENLLVEIRSLSVTKEHSKKGIGSALLKKMIQKINEYQKHKIFALTYSPDFFIKNNFIEVEKITLPEKIWKDCSKCPVRENCGETSMVYSY